MYKKTFSLRDCSPLAPAPARLCSPIGPAPVPQHGGAQLFAVISRSRVLQHSGTQKTARFFTPSRAVQQFERGYFPNSRL